MPDFKLNSIQRNTMKKLLSLFIITALLTASLFACSKESVKPSGKKNNTEVTGEQNTLKLAYSKNDPLDPMLSQTAINLRISKLVFDGLYKLDSSYEPIPVVAKSAVVGKNIVSVTINDFKFSDGMPVKTDDIIKSFERAKESEAYKARLGNFIQAYPGSENSVIFDIESPDPYALSCLDFPIVKESTDGSFPVGCGRYAYQRDGENIYLVVNGYRADFNPNFRTVNLEAVHESDSFESSLVIGNTAFSYNELNDGTYTRINANNIDIGINNFIYLGFNMQHEFFSVPAVRKAVSLCLDRQKIAASAFRSHARPAVTPFNPDWYAISDISSDNGADVQGALEAIKASGIRPAMREISILYNADNEFKADTAEIIEENLENIGFYVRLNGFTKDAYLQALKSGGYDIYIGEVKLNNNMSLYPLFTGDAAFGIEEDEAALLKYTDFVNGNCELIDFINTYSEDMPYAPVCYRNGIASYTKSMSGEFGGCDADVFYDIETWSLK